MKRVVVVLSVWYLTHLAVMAWVGLRDDVRPSDAGIVLGNFVRPDGTPGELLRGRLDRAIELYRAGAFRHVIVSGARMPGGYDEPGGMKRYLVAQGIPADAIIEDADGRNTYQTARSTRRIFRERDFKTAMVITNWWHIPRTREAMWIVGVRDVRSAPARFDLNTEEVRGVARDVVGFYGYLLYLRE